MAQDGKYGQTPYGDSEYEPPASPPLPPGDPNDGIYGLSKYGESEYEPVVLPPPPPPPVVIHDPELLWKFVLAYSDSLSNITELFSSNTTLDLALNKPGSASLTIPVDSTYAEIVEPITTCIKAYRRGQLIWSGYVWTVEDTLPENGLQINSLGWFEQLNHRYLRYEKKYEGTGWTGGTIALDLVDIANSQRTGPLSVSQPDGTGAIMPTGILTGVSQDSQARTRDYQKWQNIGQAITEWTEVENGYDFAIDPGTKTINFYNSSLGSTLRRDRPSAQFGYNWGPNNLSAFRRQLDASTIVTQLHAQGKFATVTAAAGGTSPSPLETYGLWEEHHNLNDVIDNSVLDGFANGEIAIRHEPRTIYSITPFPYTPDDARIPEPFVDYRIGDQVYFTAKYAKRIKIEGQAVRVYGLKIQIDADGNEILSDLQLSPN